MALEETPRPLTVAQERVEKIRKDKERITTLRAEGWELGTDVPYKLERLFQTGRSGIEDVVNECKKNLSPEELAKHTQTISRRPLVSPELYKIILEKVEKRFKRREV